MSDGRFASSGAPKLRSFPASDKQTEDQKSEATLSDRTDKLDGLRIDHSQKEAPKPKGFLWIAAIVLVALAAALVWWTFRAPAAASVRTAVVREATGTTAGAVLDASGYVTARRQATVSSKVTGKMAEVLVEEGMEVKKGQVLARLDDSIQTRSLALSEAQFESARSAVEESRVRLREAEINLRRVKELVEREVNSAATLDSAQASVDSLKARIEVGIEDVDVAEKFVLLRRQELEDTVIRAPFDGVAISKDAQPGEMVSPVSAGGGFTRTGISTIVDMSSLEIEVDVNEAYINRVRSEQRIEAVLDAYPDWRIHAKVITTIPAADRQNATVRVRIGFDELDPRILPDMGVKVTFLGDGDASGDTQKPRILIPRAAMRRDGGRDVVFVVQNDHVERRAVRLGAVMGDDVEVVSGLSAGERVVVEGPEELADGDRIK
jgi:RND family efflux transporter MFP subunit